MKKQDQSGFTLYELMITLLIVGIVLSYGVPNLAEFTANSRITSTANDLHSAFHLARSESARAKTNITICASADPLAADSDCDGDDGWDQGYIVFVDTNGDGARSGSDETILRTHAGAAENISLVIANDATFFGYASSGLGRGNVNGNTAISQIIICDQRGTTETSKDFSAARLFVATPLGRATVVRDLTMVENALAAMGKNCP